MIGQGRARAADAEECSSPWSNPLKTSRLLLRAWDIEDYVKEGRLRRSSSSTHELFRQLTEERRNRGFQGRRDPGGKVITSHQ